MKPPRKRRTWRETQISLSRATITTFDGPGLDFLFVVAGAREGAPRVTRQNEVSKRADRRIPKRGR